MKNLLIAFTILHAFYGISQLKQNVADAHFERMEYYKCVEMYDELAAKTIKGAKKSSWDNVRKAAESHFHLFQMDEAVDYYQRLHAKNEINEKDREFYIQALRYIENYGKSEEIIRESAQKYTSNHYFRRLLIDLPKFNQLFQDSAFYRLKEAPINSGQGDFGPAYYEKSLVYATKSVNPGFVTPAYGWDGDFYMNVMQAEMNADSSLQEGKLLRNTFLSRAHDGPVSFTLDGKQMVITRNTPGKKKGKDVIVLGLYFSQKSNGDWSEPKAFEFNNSAYNVGHGVFSEDGNRLYFSSEAPNGHGGADLYVCERQGNSWTTPKNLGPNINTEMDELFPFVQESTLYFASNGWFGLGGLDIYSANMDGSTQAHNIGYPVNTSHDDFGLIFNEEGVLGYMSSNRNDNIDRIYHVKKRKINLNLVCTVYEQYDNKEILPNQKVWIRNVSTNELDSLITDEQGKINTTIKINQDYRLFTKKHEFMLLKEENRSTQGIKRDTTIQVELVLKPTTIMVHLRVVRKDNGKVIPAATVTVTDYATQWDSTLVTNEDGLVSLKVKRNVVYWAHGSKRGFIDADVSFNTSNQNGKVIDLELALPPIKKGEKFKLENIFYDLNKSTLRPESKTALDKLADFIIQNNLRIELSAHTDSRGSNTYNQKLSQARAQSCVDYLISKGVKSSNIKAKGYGESQLVNRCKDGVQCSEDEHQENRRTEVKILEVN